MLVPTQRTKETINTDEERCILGTVVVDEFRKDVEMDCVLVDMFEFWEYEVTCIDRSVYFQNT